jgi:hypothetical protein
MPAKAEPRSRLPGWLNSTSIIIGAIVLVAVGTVVFAINAMISPPVNVRTQIIDGVQNFPGLVPSHVDGAVNYPQTPPAGGAHNPVWQNCGVYTEPVANEHAVHSLEHGAIWMTYQPDLPADQLQTLQDITRQGSHRLLSPYPGIDSPIILTAWGFQLRLTRADDPRLMQFILKYEEGPSTPERGAACSGGESRTLRELMQG